MANAPFSWEFHPATRSSNLISLYGGLNDNLGQLALECFDHTELAGLSAQRAIYAVPGFDATKTAWKNWNQIYLPSQNSRIFR